MSHSSKESEIIPLSAGLRTDGIPALDLWDVVSEVLHSLKITESQQQEARGNMLRNSNPKPPKNETEMLMNCQVLITLSQKQVLLLRRMKVVYL